MNFFFIEKMLNYNFIILEKNTTTLNINKLGG